MTRDELLAQLAGLHQARVGQVRVPHKPLLLLWLFGQFAATGSSQASYQQAEAPVSQLINDFGPSVANAAAARQRAAMPFVHLERDLWDLRDAAGNEIAPDAPERRTWLLDRGAGGRLRPPVEQLLADPATLAAAARLLLDLHFTPVLAELICAAVDLDVPALDLAGTERVSRTVRLPRRRGFAEEVLRAYAYQCAMCGFDGALGHYPVAIEAAHVRWHSQQGPDEIANALALCPLCRRRHKGHYADLQVMPGWVSGWVFCLLTDVCRGGEVGIIRAVVAVILALGAFRRREIGHGCGVAGAGERAAGEVRCRVRLVSCRGRLYAAVGG